MSARDLYNLHENKIEIIQKYDDDGKYHCEDGPAYVAFCASTGKVITEKWYRHESLYNPNGPAIISYYDNGNVKEEIWYNNSKRSRLNGPARIVYGENGNIGMEYWIMKGIAHRENGPANITYYTNGNRCKEDWYLNGLKHRADGPAEIQYLENGFMVETKWFINDVEISEQEIIDTIGEYEYPLTSSQQLLLKLKYG